MFTEFVQKSKMRYLIEGLDEIQKNHIDRVAVVYTVSNPIKKLQEVTKAATSSPEAMLAS